MFTMHGNYSLIILMDQSNPVTCMIAVQIESLPGLSFSVDETDLVRTRRQSAHEFILGVDALDALWRTNVELLNETRHEQVDLLTSQQLSQTGTLACDEQ